MPEEHLVEMVNEFLGKMKTLEKALKSANSDIRSLRTKVKRMDAEEFNENPPDVVEAFYRNYERVDNIRQGIRIVLNNIKRLDVLPEEE